LPELPEVETIKRQLESRVVGQKIVKVVANCHALVFRDYPGKKNISRELSRKKIKSLNRRGKYLLFSLDQGLTLVIHLGMSGTLLIRDQNAPRDRHCHLEIFFQKFKLSFRDPRMFGRLALIKDSDFSSLPGLLKLGPEPLSREFNAQWLSEKFRGRKAPVKALLLDQSVGAGIGNIYSDEALHLAGISPLRKAGNLNPQEIAGLTSAVKKILKEAIAKIGCTFRDYRTTEGALGNFQPRVYGRKGEPCKRCGGQIKRTRLGNRSSFFCTQCQH